jgi:hypothetical protein
MPVTCLNKCKRHSKTEKLCENENPLNSLGLVSLCHENWNLNAENDSAPAKNSEIKATAPANISETHWNFFGGQSSLSTPAKK